MTRLLKYLVITVLVFGSLSSMAQTPTGTKTRTPGVWLSSKDTATNRTAADSIQIIANRADSSLRFYWSVGAPSRKIALSSDLIAINDSLARKVALQTSNIYRQTGKIWVNDTIKTDGNFVSTNGNFVASGTDMGFIGQYLSVSSSTLSGAVGRFNNTNSDGLGAFIVGGSTTQKFTLKLFGYNADSIANFNPLGAYFYKKTYLKDTLFINTTNTIIDMDAAEKVNIVMDRGSNSYDNLITYETAAAKNWEVGTRAGRTSYSIYNNSTATNGILIDSVTNEVSVASLKLSDWQQKQVSGHFDFDYIGSNMLRVRNDGSIQSKYSFEAYKNGSNTFGLGPFLGVFNAAGTQAMAWGLDGSNDMSLFNEGGTRLGYFDQSTGAYTALSDSSAKKDITNYTKSGISAIMKMQPKYYRMKADSADYRSLWFIAQDVKDAIPEAYIEKGGGNGEKPFIGINEKPIIANLVKAVQEQQAQINTLKSELEAIKAILLKNNIK